MAYLTAPKGYDVPAIFQTWDKLLNWAKDKGIFDNNRYAICHDNPSVTPIEKCCYQAAIELNSDTQVYSLLIPKRFPAGQYAKAYFEGLGDEVSQFYMELYSTWLPQSGYEPDNHPPIGHYLNDSRAEGENGIVKMDLYIKVKPLAL
ncbi:GyrI-like domain-containing protein [Catenovulum sp. SM1970]|uniref:GyrI-like domain-containing protein n=1 Tax=Marinifaba aquimaris TaxID=2741323 RepID=UPI0015719FB7|nr:GyrI-like domain-containing protein [Marinifaba aquimaris]